MCRTSFTPRSLGRTLIVALCLFLSARAASAQERRVQVAVGETKRVSMSKMQTIMKVDNPKPQICKIDGIEKVSNAVFVTGLAPGASLVEFTDADKNIEVIEVFVGGVAAPTAEKFTIPRVRQVELEVLVCVVNRSELRAMSFNWAENRASYFISSLIGTTTNSPLLLTSGISTAITGAGQSLAGTPNLQFGVIGDRHSFLGFLEALRTEKLAKVLSEPRIVALSGQKADILSGGEIPTVVIATAGSSPTIEYKQFGTSVSFIPVVLENGGIQLTVGAELSARNAANDANVQGIFAPAFDTRRARSVVLIEDRQTLAIGGLIQNTVAGTTKKVPILGDIPFLGTAFSATSYEEKEEEMLILVTPRLIDPLDCTQIPHRLPGRETRGPDDFELFLTQILEAPRGQREVCPDGRFRAAHLNGPTAGIYPCNDNSQRHGWGRGCANGNCTPSSHSPGAVRTSVTAPQVETTSITPPPPSTPLTPATLPSELPQLPQAPPMPSLPETLPENRPLAPASLGGPVSGIE
jgi:pilus assembly protein CpaC